MPSKNIVKLYDVDSYYHIYNRGVEKRAVFLDEHDYSVFLGLLKRHLGKKPCIGSNGREYEWLTGSVEINAFCLMPNHFHLLLYQRELDAITKLLRAVCSSYVTYFNNKYDRVGTLFQGNFKAKRINKDDYLLHITRYIHRNPRNYINYRWSSLDYWLENKKVDWVCIQRINKMEIGEYLRFINDDSDYEMSDETISDLKL